MKKEDILKQSRQEHQDEGMQYAENQGRKIGYIVFSILYVILDILSLFFWQLGTLYALSSLFFTFFCAEWFAKYHFTKKKTYLVSAICAVIAAIIFTINFIRVVAGVMA